MHVSFESIQSIFEAIFNLPCALAHEIIRDKLHERFTPKFLVNRWIDRISVTVLNRLHTPPQRHGWFIGCLDGREVSPTGILLAHKARIIPTLPARTSWMGKRADWDLSVCEGREDLIALRRAFESHSRKRSRNNAPFCLRALISLGQIFNLEVAWKRSRCIALTSM